jgi:hypothetical protein
MQGSFQPGAEEALPSGAEPEREPQGLPAEARKRGRLEWWLLVAAAIAAVPLWLWRGTGFGPGAVVEIPLSLITADKHELACAHPEQFGRYRCAFRAPDEPWPDPPAPADTLTQYLTPDRRLFLVAGLFEQRDVAARYASEPPQGKRPSQLRRFVATCNVRLLKKVPWVHARWAKHASFGESGSAWVAEPLDCTLRDE